ncbi:paraflagellar rod protein, putative [Bodo saltans]|uniref:Paraflagellar rod protein, putative n=1 Tax=Bodo saltans TaxID=75058 RepID=A0A0S4JG44_BODSA|nr:paraflagellar rod protein, putative [Bodo saltans]|eukprot:CUG90524.1 paraflagellar rod protein, putative [Bodo saltans]
MTDIIGKTNGLLNQTNEALADVNKKIAEAEEALSKSLMQEQMHEAEKWESELLSLAEKRMELFVKRVCVLTASDENSQDGGALKQLEQIIRNPIVGQLHTEKESLKATVEADIQALEADRVEKLRENDNAILRYDANVIKRIKGLQANHALQHEKWIQLEQLIAEISSLDREGDRLTREHVLMTEIEQKRRQEHREYRQSYTNHRQHLDSLLENTISAIDFTQQLSSALLEGKEKLIEARIEDSLKDLLKRERKQYLEAFEYYGVKNQTDVGRNEKRMAALDRMLNDLAFVRRQCRDTGDDGSTAYAKRMNDIDRQVRKCRKAAETLEDSFTRHESTYIKLETAMLAALGDQANSVLASSSSPHDDPVTLHIKIKTTKADQFRQFVDQVSALTSSTVSSMAELRNRQEQLSVTASTMKEASERKKAANRSSMLSSRGTVSPRTPGTAATADEFDRPAGVEDEFTADGDAAAGNTTTNNFDEDTVNVSNIEVENVSVN